MSEYPSFEIVCCARCDEDTHLWYAVVNDEMKCHKYTVTIVEIN